jgi:hypothetical protein
VKIGFRMSDMGCGMSDVGCGMWDVGFRKPEIFLPCTMILNPNLKP